MANSIEQEIGRRRTFAIISHPDAGKTTLTEKFLSIWRSDQYSGVCERKGKLQTCSI